MNKASNDEGRVRVAQRRADPWETLAEAQLTGDARAARRAFAQVRTRLRARLLLPLDAVLLALQAERELSAATMTQLSELRKRGDEMSGRTDISGGTFPLVIDQEDITAPGFPRGQEWWGEFVPVNWITMEVRGDGTVTLDASGYRSHFTDGGWVAGPERLTAAEYRRRRGGMVRWVGSSLGRHLREAA